MLQSTHIDQLFEIYTMCLRVYAHSRACVPGTVVMAETTEELQSALKATWDYCQTWHSTVNTSKTKVVIFSRGKVRPHPNVLFGQRKLYVTDNYVCIGTSLN